MRRRRRPGRGGSDAEPDSCPGASALVRNNTTVLTSHPSRVATLPDGGHMRHRLRLAAIVLGTLMGAVAVLPGLDEVRRRFAEAEAGWLGVSLLLQVGSCLAFVAVFRGVFCRRLDWRSSYRLGITVQGTNVLLPAGGASGLALAAWALHRMGMPGDRLAARSVAFFILTSAVNFLTAALVGAALALGVLAGDSSLTMTAGPALLATGAMLLVVALPHVLRPAHARDSRTDRAFRAIQRALGDGVREAGSLLGSGNALIVAGAVGYMCFDVAALGAAFAALGTLPPIGVLLLAYVLGQLGGLLPLPGGVGGADGGLIAALAVYGIPLAEAAAAVLAYRAFQLGLPALLGTLAVTRMPDVLAIRLDGDERTGDAGRNRATVAAG